MGSSQADELHSDFSYISNTDRDERSPWAQKAVLSMDGGGIRGYASLLILGAIMDEIKRIEGGNENETSSADYPWNTQKSSKDTNSGNTFYPCHYFDYIAGTSTGGLSAIMLGRLRMSTTEAVSQYTRFGNTVFGKARWFHERSFLFFPRAKFATRKVEEAILDVINQKLKKHNSEVKAWKPRQEPFKTCDGQCRVMVVAFSIDSKAGIDNSYLFRSYDHEDPEWSSKSEHLNPGPAYPGPIINAARATSAAPLYIEPIEFDGRKFFDGGLGANNPAKIALKEVYQMHARPPNLLLSIGTGEKPPKAPKSKRQRAREEIDGFKQADTGKRKRFIRKWIELFGLLKDFTSNKDSGDVTFMADVMKMECFKRFEIPFGGTDDIRLGEIPLDEWQPPSTGADTIKKIQDYTDKHLKQSETKQHINEIAKSLVELRRRRAQTERWEIFATDIKYQCPVEECRQIPGYFRERNLLREHFKYTHGAAIEGFHDNLECMVDAGRVTGKMGKKAEAAKATANAPADLSA